MIKYIIKFQDEFQYLKIILNLHKKTKMKSKKISFTVSACPDDAGMAQRMWSVL